VAAVLGLVAAACGGDDDSDAAAPEDMDDAEVADEAPELDFDMSGTIDGEDVRVLTIDTPEAPGPPELNRVQVLQHGPPDAENVLVLVPGTSAGAGYFSPVALDLVDELPGWQVWSVDRRENALEDHSVRAQRFEDDGIPAEEVWNYYVEWIVDDSIGDHFEPQGGTGSDDETVAFARDWGMNVAIDDLRAVIEEAKSLGGEVVLGGHSLGGSISVAYATWDFDGRPGAEDLSGLVLIDGGGSAGGATTVEEAEQQLAELEEGSPFNDIGFGIPWIPGVLNALGSSAVLLEPDAPNVAWESSLLPDNLKPEQQPTNVGQYGFALDGDTAPENLDLVKLHMGELDKSQEPWGWTNNELVSVQRAARMFSGPEGLPEIDGTAWYHPQRLNIDSGAVNFGNENPAQEVLDVRAIHGDKLDFPVYALATTFGGDGVLAIPGILAEQSGIPEDDLTLVDETDRLFHTDPLAIDTEQNPLRETLVPFLDAIG
jgi:pimeloyl-ACP methyl ester carboxylesterase